MHFTTLISDATGEVLETRQVDNERIEINI